MPLFDRILIVDWSGAGQPVTGKNSLWACLARREGDGHAIEWIENFSTRHAFIERLEAVVSAAVAENQRLLCGFDFAFGYPAGTAERLTGAADWRALWRKIADEIEDAPDNRNNRFDLASRWNATILPASRVSGDGRISMSMPISPTRSRPPRRRLRSPSAALSSSPRARNPSGN